MTKEQKQKLIKLRCKAWGITEDEYYCNQCSDFSLEDMARAYRRGKNKVRAELQAQIEKMKCGQNCKFEYWINTGGCYDQKCRFTGLDCTNCKDKWKGKWEND